MNNSIFNDLEEIKAWRNKRLAENYEKNFAIAGNNEHLQGALRPFYQATVSLIDAEAEGELSHLLRDKNWMRNIGKCFNWYGGIKKSKNISIQS